MARIKSLSEHNNDRDAKVYPQQVIVLCYLDRESEVKCNLVGTEQVNNPLEPMRLRITSAETSI